MVSMVEMLSRMRADVEERERSLERLKATVSRLESFVSSLTPEELAEFEKQINESAQVRAAFDVPEPKRERGKLPPSYIAAAVKDILTRVRRPMKRGEIVEELARQGVELAGVDKNKNLGTILWRHKNEFIQIDNLGYWLKDVPLEGIYSPPG